MSYEHTFEELCLPSFEGLFFNAVVRFEYRMVDASFDHSFGIEKVTELEIGEPLVLSFTKNNEHGESIDIKSVEIEVILFEINRVISQSNMDSVQRGILKHYKNTDGDFFESDPVEEPNEEPQGTDKEQEW